MSDYTKSTNFAVKDGLTTGDPAKRIKGTEIDVEYNAIASAIASKADANSPTFTGTPVAPTAAPGTNTTQLSTTAFVKAAIDASVTTEQSSTATLTNKTISADSNTLSGIAASSFVLSNASGNIDGSAAQKAIPSGVVVGTTDTQTLTNKTIDLGSNTVSGTKAQFNTAVTDTDIAFLNDFTGSNQSLDTSGFQRIPGGLIMQWGTVGTLSADSAMTVTFPTSFTALYNIQVTIIENGGSDRQVLKIGTTSTTSFTVRNTTSSTYGNAYWFAIGTKT